MEVQLQDLVEKIKNDGIASGEKQAARIIAEAETRAKTMLDDARTEAAALLKQAEAESARFTTASEAAVKQACRNALIIFQEGVIGSLNALIQTETAAAYTSHALKDLIPETVKGLVKAEGSELSIILSSDNAKKLESALLGSFKQKIEKGIEVQSDSRLAEGFRVGIQNGAAYYDFSAEAVAQLFSTYVSSRAARIMQEAAKEL